MSEELEPDWPGFKGQLSIGDLAKCLVTEFPCLCPHFLVSQHVLQSAASSGCCLAALTASFFAGSLKEAQGSLIPEMTAPGQTLASAKGYGKGQWELESRGDEKKGESALPLALIALGPCRGRVAALLCSLFSFLSSSIEGHGSKNQCVEEAWIQWKKV